MSKVPCEQKSQLVDPRGTFTRGVIAGQNTCSIVSNTVEIFFATLILYAHFWMSKVHCEQKSQLVDPRGTFTHGVVAGQNTCSTVSNTVEIFFATFILLCPFLDVKGTLRTKKSIG